MIQLFQAIQSELLRRETIYYYVIRVNQILLTKYPNFLCIFLNGGHYRGIDDKASITTISVIWQIVLGVQEHSSLPACEDGILETPCRYGMPQFNARTCFLCHTPSSSQLKPAIVTD